MKTVLTVFVILPLLYTAGVAQNSSKSYTEPYNNATHTVSCSGYGKSWSDCYREADTLCPDGYKIIKKSTGVISTPVNGKSTLAPLKKLVIECN